MPFVRTGGLQSEFCTPYEAHEKGGIESEAGYFRRNHWVPIPKARDLAELNAQLLAACHEDEQRQIAGRGQPVGAAMIEERAHLLPLAEQGFELAEVCFPRVDGLGCVRVRTNLYSVPVKPDKTVEVRLYPSYVEVRDEGRCIARHERNYGRQQQVLDLEHYWMCWSASRERWPAPSRSRRGGKKDCGQRVTIGCWKS